MRVGSVFPHCTKEGDTVSEMVTFFGVSKSSAYPDDGTDEDNSFAKFSPSVNLTMQIANPALFGKLEVGATFYVDFSPVS